VYRWPMQVESRANPAAFCLFDLGMADPMILAPTLF